MECWERLAWNNFIREEFESFIVGDLEIVKIKKLEKVDCEVNL